MAILKINISGHRCDAMLQYVITNCSDVPSAAMYFCSFELIKNLFLE